MSSVLLSRPRIIRHRLFHDPSYPTFEELSDTQRAMIAELNDKIAAGRIGFRPISCLCGETEAKVVATVDRYRIRQETVICCSCGLLRSDPLMDDAALDWFYSSDFYRKLYSGEDFIPHTSENFFGMLGTADKRFDIIAEILPDKRFTRVAEIGCGAGWNLYPFFKRGIVTVGCDYSPEMTAFGRTMGMDIRTGSIEQLQDGKCDLVIMSHVLEHMPDPKATIRAADEILEDDGAIYIEVPDLREFCIGTLQSAHVWTFAPDHLCALLRKCGFEAVSVVKRGCHFAAVFQRSAEAETGPNGRYGEIAAMLAKHERRQQLKDMLDSIGLLARVQSVARLLRGR